jgi:hypothetical protein
MEEASKPIIKIYGTRGSAACYSIRDYLHRSDVPFEWIDLGSDQQGPLRGADLGSRRSAAADL